MNSWGNRGVQNRDEIQHLLTDRKVLLALNGHDHGDDLKIKNDIPYFTVNSASHLYQGVRALRVYSSSIYQAHPALQNMILYKETLICTIEAWADGVRVVGMESEYDQVCPEQIGLTDCTWNGISIRPHISSWEHHRDLAKSTPTHRPYDL